MKIQPVDSSGDSIEYLPLHLFSESDRFGWENDEQKSPKRLIDKQEEFPHMAHLDNYHPPSFKVPIELLKQTPVKEHQGKNVSEEDNCLKESSVVMQGTLHIDQKICYNVLEDNSAQQTKNPLTSAKKPKRGWIFIDQPK